MSSLAATGKLEAVEKLMKFNEALNQERAANTEAYCRMQAKSYHDAELEGILLPNCVVPQHALKKMQP